MAISKPFRRTCRQFKDGKYSEGGRWRYILHPKFAKAPPGQYIRAFLLLQQDLQHLFQYVEPSDINLNTYSFRIHELLLRTCVEIEANFKVILTENGYSKSGNWNRKSYKKIDDSHFLSKYEVKFPSWIGVENIRKPFSPWSSSGSLQWYSDYNATKHDRHTKFHRASLQNLTDAMAGLIALLSSQFWTHDFSPSDWNIVASGHDDEMESAIGGYFRIKFPDNVQMDDRYEFDWQILKDEEDPFNEYKYD